jgi:DNA modification methylase
MSLTEKRSSLLDTRVINCGDNCKHLKKLPDNCIDLVYVDPSSCSNGTREYLWDSFKRAIEFTDRPESTQAYLDFMRPRCVELARVLKPTGSFYFHCDWDAKHYIQEMLDEVLGRSNFINEFRWKQHSDHTDAPPSRFGRVHDTLLLYGGDSKCYFEHLYRPRDEDYIDRLYTQVEFETGRRYRLGDLVVPVNAALIKGKPQYEFLGVTAYWRFSQDDMRKLHAQGRIQQSALGADPRLKQYLDEIVGVPVGSAWDGIQPLRKQCDECLVDLAQEPLKLLGKLLEIALQASGGALDECEGRCTALVAALEPERQWIGIGHFNNVLPLYGGLKEGAVTNGDGLQTMPETA